jgi:hypothetical protein
MENQKDKKDDEEIGKEKAPFGEAFLPLNDDSIVFVPAENIRAINHVIDNWEVVRQQWKKMVQTFIY